MLVFLFSKLMPNLIKLAFAQLLVLFGYKKEYEDNWLVSERGTDARDNGYFFFRYLREQHPMLSCCYVIDKCSSDYEKVKKLGRVVEYRSFEHFVALIRSKYLISSHIMGFTPEPEVFLILQKRNIFDLQGKKIFLQHGIIKDNIEGLKYPNVKVDLFLCGAYDEYRYIRDTYCHPKEVVRFTGLARYDSLNNKNVKRQILVMPTWRKWLNSMSEQEFVQTEYYNQYFAFLNDKKLYKWLENNQYELVFYPHYEMQKFIHLFHLDHSRVHIGYFEDYDVQTLLKESSLLITDYSSVYFDFAYLNKPIVYYQFDEEQFYENHYAKGYFNDRNFGPVVKEKEELLKYLDLFLNAPSEMFNYKNNQRAFFEKNPHNCCEKIYQAILTLGKDNRHE